MYVTDSGASWSFCCCGVPARRAGRYDPVGHPRAPDAITLPHTHESQRLRRPRRCCRATVHRCSVPVTQSITSQARSRGRSTEFGPSSAPADRAEHAAVPARGSRSPVPTDAESRNFDPPVASSLTARHFRAERWQLARCGTKSRVRVPVHYLLKEFTRRESLPAMFKLGRWSRDRRWTAGRRCCRS